MIANYALVLGILFFIINNSYINFYRRKEEKIIRINESKLELKEIEKKQALMTIENDNLNQKIEADYHNTYYSKGKYETRTLRMKNKQWHKLNKYDNSRKIK